LKRLSQRGISEPGKYRSPNFSKEAWEGVGVFVAGAVEEDVLFANDLKLIGFMPEALGVVVLGEV
jgi:hypothetical protein